MVVYNRKQSEPKYGRAWCEVAWDTDEAAIVAADEEDLHVVLACC